MELPELDLETKKQLDEDQAVADTRNSEGWKIIKKRLTHILVDYDSIHGLVVEPDKNILDIINMRKEVISRILAVIADVEGTANKNNFNKPSFTDLRNEEVIEYFR